MTTPAFLVELDKIFFEPARKGGALAPVEGKTYDYAYVNASAYPIQEYVDAIVANKSRFGKVILNTANDKKDTPGSISGRLAQAIVAADDTMRGRILLASPADWGLNTGAECQKVVTTLDAEGADQVDGRYETLAFARPWHIARCNLTAEKQAASLAPTFIGTEYAGYNMYTDGLAWTKNPEVCDWIVSELGRLIAYGYNTNPDRSDQVDLVEDNFGDVRHITKVPGHEGDEPRKLVGLYQQMVAYRAGIMIGAKDELLAQYGVEITPGFFGRAAPKPGEHLNAPGDTRVDDIFNADKVSPLYAGKTPEEADALVQSLIAVPAPLAPTRTVAPAPKLAR